MKQKFLHIEVVLYLAYTCNEGEERHQLIARRRKLLIRLLFIANSKTFLLKKSNEKI